MTDAQPGNATTGGAGSASQTPSAKKRRSRLDYEYLEMAERHRFWMAISLISVFGIVLGMSFNQSFATQPSVVISAFSGWIAAMITFYYTGQSVDSALQDASEAKSDAKVTKNNAIEGAKKVVAQSKAVQQACARTKTGAAPKPGTKGPGGAAMAVMEETFGQPEHDDVAQSLSDLDEAVREMIYKLA